MYPQVVQTLLCEPPKGDNSPSDQLFNGMQRAGLFVKTVEPQGMSKGDVFKDHLGNRIFDTPCSCGPSSGGSLWEG